jgi:hypothetical protein
VIRLVATMTVVLVGLLGTTACDIGSESGATPPSAAATTPAPNELSCGVLPAHVITEVTGLTTFDAEGELRQDRFSSCRITSPDSQAALILKFLAPSSAVIAKDDLALHPEGSGITHTPSTWGKGYVDAGTANRTRARLYGKNYYVELVIVQPSRNADQARDALAVIDRVRGLLTPMN